LIMSGPINVNAAELLWGLGHDKCLEEPNN